MGPYIHLRILPAMQSSSHRCCQCLCGQQGLQRPYRCPSSRASRIHCSHCDLYCAGVRISPCASITPETKGNLLSWVGFQGKKGSIWIGIHRKTPEPVENSKTNLSPKPGLLQPPCTASTWRPAGCQK